MEKRLCYITRNYRNRTGAGNKAKTDNEDTLQALGATNLGLHRTFHPGHVRTFVLDLLGVVRYCFAVRPGDVVLLQYPVKKYFAFLCRVARLRGAKTVALIHDLGSFRRRKLTVEKEIGRLMHADQVIASNSVMQQWLSDHGYTHPLTALGLFDYRSPAQPRTPSDSTRLRLVYAGALAMRKNAFLLQLAEQDLPYDLHVYGNRDGLPGLADNPHIVFHPFTPADTFISEVDADFGFVWDGDSLDSCTGHFGEYLRWNSPHKVSFYLRAGLPVVVWRLSAVAPIVESEGIGLCIDSVHDLTTLLPQVTPQQMQHMRQQVARIASRLAQGDFLTQALQRTALL